MRNYKESKKFVFKLALLSILLFYSIFAGVSFMFLNIAKSKFNYLALKVENEINCLVQEFLENLEQKKISDEKVVYDVITDRNFYITKIVANNKNYPLFVGYKIGNFKLFKSSNRIKIKYSHIVGDFVLYYFEDLNSGYEIKVFKIKEIFPSIGVVNVNETLVLITYENSPLIIYNSSPLIFPYPTFEVSGEIVNIGGKKYSLFRKKIKNSEFVLNVLISHEIFEVIYKYLMISFGAIVIIGIIFGVWKYNLIMNSIILPIAMVSEGLKEGNTKKIYDILSKSRKNILEVSNLSKNLMNFLNREKLLKDEIESIRKYYWEIINKSPSIIIVMNEALRVTLFNVNAHLAFGVDKGTKISKTPLYKYLKPLILQILKRKGTESVKGEFIYRDKGKLFIYEINLYRIEIGANQHFVAVFRDKTVEATTLRELEENIRKNDLVLTSISEVGIGVVLYKKDIIGIDLIDVNSAVYEIFGIRKEEEGEVYAYLTEIIEEIEDKMRNIEYLKQKKVRSIKTSVRSFSGDIKYIEYSEFSIVEHDYVITTGLIRDITEEKLLIERILKEDRLETMGILAGGVAHDFNNVLGGLLGNIEMLERVDDLKKIKKYTKKMRAIVERASSIINQILVFSRGKVELPETIDVLEVIVEAVEIAKRTLKKKIRIKVRGEKGKNTVYADKGQLFHTLLNLLINAGDAVEDVQKPIILIEAKRERINKDRAKKLGISEGEYVIISVEDNGTGIPEDIMDRIFDPFFTTKKKGTGLGLAMIRRIVRDYKGEITVESEFGKGSKFTIYLPYKEVFEKKGEAKKEEKSFIKGFIIFVVDDEYDIRVTLQEFLEMEGNKVYALSNGAELMERLSRVQPDVILLDMVMPVMDGYEVLEKLKKLRYEIPVVIISGYFIQDEDIKEKYDFVKAIFKKPVQFELISQVLNELRGK